MVETNATRDEAPQTEDAQAELAQTADAPAISARGLIRIHPSAGGPVAALRGLDLTVTAGEIAAIVGPSGSGKSTLLRLVAGLDRPSAGSLTVLGVDVARASQSRLDSLRRERIGIVEQHYRRALSPYLRAAKAVELPLALRGVGAAERERRSSELLRLVGLADRRGAYRAELSGGEQQRVAFAVALASRPVLLVADEPTGELDGVTAEEVLFVLRDVVRAEGATCLIVTHDEMVERIADRVVHLADGRAVAQRVGPAGPRATPVRDGLGWLAPPLPHPVTPVAPASDVAEGPAAVVLDGVGRVYATDGARSTGLARITATLGRGRFHVITGPSGSGKSTLLRLITGLDRPTAGSLTVLDTDPAGLDREGLARFRADHIGLVDQVRDLVPFLSAKENVELGLAIRGEVAPDDPDRALAALARFGLAGLADRSPDRLSAGERLRVALARALVSEPELVVLDEPTAALDRAGARMVARLLQELADGHVTVIATTHDAALIAAASDRLDLGAISNQTAAVAQR
jgi:ABC-type lipoprotein export system ATPase subunit